LVPAAVRPVHHGLLDHAAKTQPDAAELIRAKTGRVVGALAALLVVMKGLPLAYQKDMQEDKEGTIDAFGTLSQSIALMTKMVDDMTPDVAAMANAAGAGYSTATDLADWLVRTLKLPFRDAHHITGRIVAEAAAAGRGARKTAACGHAGGRAAHHQGGLRRALVGNSVKSRKAYGGTAPQNVRAQAKRWLKLLKKRRKRPAKRLGKRLPTHVAAAIWFAMLGFERASGERPLARYRLSVGVALAAAILAALSLAACGRKGELEMPPGPRPSRRSPPRRCRRQGLCRTTPARRRRSSRKTPPR